MLTRRKRVSAKTPKASKRVQKKSVVNDKISDAQVWNTPIRSLSAPVPARMCVRMRYASTFSLNPGAAGVAATQVFSCNGCYDPDITGVGHQPLGFDQLLGLYKYYVVPKSQITAKFQSRNSSTYGCVVGVTIFDTTSTMTDINDLLEFDKTKHNMLDFSASAAHSTVSNYYNQRYSAGTKDLSGDDVLAGSVSSNPAKQYYFHCFAAPVQAVDADTLDCYAVIDYEVMLYEPIQIVSS